MVVPHNHMDFCPRSMVVIHVGVRSSLDPMGSLFRCWPAATAHTPRHCRRRCSACFRNLIGILAFDFANLGLFILLYITTGLIKLSLEYMLLHGLNSFNSACSLLCWINFLWSRNVKGEIFRSMSLVTCPFRVFLPYTKCQKTGVQPPRQRKQR